MVALIFIVPILALAVLLFTAGPERTAVLVQELPALPAGPGATCSTLLFALDPPFGDYAQVVTMAVTDASGRQTVYVTTPPDAPGDGEVLWTVGGTSDPGNALSANGYIIAGTPAHEERSSSRAAGIAIAGAAAMALVIVALVACFRVGLVA